MIIAALLTVTVCITAQTNDFYDDAPGNPLKGTGKILVTGEVADEMTVDLSSLPLRDVIVKETSIEEGKVTFIGAYRYSGYSVYDILDRVVLKKKNEKEFPPIIDLCVEVSNDKGESVVLSWGEIYYPNNRHQILVATNVRRIVPSKTKDLWPLPAESRLVVGPDLITVRNISNPSRITIRSLDNSYEIIRDLNPMYCDRLRVKVNGEEKEALVSTADLGAKYTYNTVFYGRGRGIHGTTPFTGARLSSLVGRYYTPSVKAIREGIVVIAGADGYRSAFTISEIMNRNDQQEFLLIENKRGEDGGLFSLFAAADYFSDRAIKSIMEISIQQ